jgi:hypothetical protein
MMGTMKQGMTWNMPFSVQETATTPLPAGCQSMAETHLFFE